MACLPNKPGLQALRVQRGAHIGQPLLQMALRDTTGTGLGPWGLWGQSQPWHLGREGSSCWPSPARAGVFREPVAVVPMACSAPPAL